jgi:hypothetical protein
MRRRDITESENLPYWILDELEVERRYNVCDGEEFDLDEIWQLREDMVRDLWNASPGECEQLKMPEDAEDYHLRWVISETVPGIKILHCWLKEKR